MEPYIAKLREYQASAKKFIEDDKTPACKTLKKVATNLKTEPLYVALGVAAFVVCLALFWESACNFFSLLVGGVFPVLQAAKAIREDNNGEIRRWTFFLIFSSLFLFTDFFYDIVTSLFVVYPQFKLFLLVWAVWPTNPSGPEVLFNKVIEHIDPPKYTPPPTKADSIKEALEKANKAGKDVAKEVEKAATDVASATETKKAE